MAYKPNMTKRIGCRKKEIQRKENKSLAYETMASHTLAHRPSFTSVALKE